MVVGTNLLFLRGRARGGCNAKGGGGPMYSGGVVAGGLCFPPAAGRNQLLHFAGGLDEPPIPWTPPQQDSAGAEGEGGCLWGSEGSPVLPGWGKEEVQHRQPSPCPPRLEGGR